MAPFFYDNTTKEKDTPGHASSRPTLCCSVWPRATPIGHTGVTWAGAIGPGLFAKRIVKSLFDKKRIVSNFELSTTTQQHHD